jgi:DNA replication and repair protein RecF
MRLTRLAVERLRNLKAIEVELPEGLTVIAGGNGEGKTSLLEAVYLLGTGRSFRTRKTDEAVSFDGGPLVVRGQVSGRRGDSRLCVMLDGTNRRLQVNEADKGLEQYLGRLNLVDLTARRMNVLRGGPEERRRFLDRGILGRDPSYLRFIGDYRRALQNRNALLRRRQVPEDRKHSELDAWDAPMLAAAGSVHLRRRAYAERLGSSLDDACRMLFGPGARLALRYLPSPPESGRVPDDRVSEVLAERLARCRRRDVEMGHTTEGPHRDDLAIELNGTDLLRFGSAGQNRAAMIALKLGKLSLLQEEWGEPPLFLMDDFDSDLDDGRMSALAGFLHHGGFQTLVATSKESQVDRIDVSFMKLRIEALRRARGGPAQTGA